jgi:hypothetical protein
MVENNVLNYIVNRSTWFIRQWVEHNVVNHNVNQINAKELWTELESLYASNIGNNKLIFLKQIMHSTYKENNSISNHLKLFLTIFLINISIWVLTSMTKFLLCD